MWEPREGKSNPTEQLEKIKSFLGKMKPGFSVKREIDKSKQREGVS